jgi:hypothetical protein
MPRIIRVLNKRRGDKPVRRWRWPEFQPPWFTELSLPAPPVLAQESAVQDD